MNLETLIKNHKAKIGVIGMGYVGLPLSLEFSLAGFEVTGFDVSQKKIDALKKGHSYISDIASARLKRIIKNKKLKPTTDFKQLNKMDVVIICVPTPLRKTKDPDVSYILSAVGEISKNFRKGQLIILESTTYPGTTRELLLPKLTNKKHKVGRDFFLAFSPERVDPGNKKFGIRNTPKVVGGITPACTKLADLLYSSIVDRTVPVTSTESAEMVKLLENTFRAVNIGLVNEVALMCDRLKLDPWEVIDAAATKPFGFMSFYPGPGLGGHCIPLDPHYLSWKLKTLNFYSRFIELAGEINSNMPDYVITKIDRGLNDRKKAVKGSKILILGVAYKKDVSDVRESPALDVIELLNRRKAKISYHDPYVPKLKVSGLNLKSVPLTDATLKRQDCVVITTHHSLFNVQKIVKAAKLVIDARNATKGIRNKNVVKL